MASNEERFGTPATRKSILDKVATDGVWEVGSDGTSVNETITPYSAFPGSAVSELTPYSAVGDTNVESPAGLLGVDLSSQSTPNVGTLNNKEMVTVRPLVVGITGGIASGKSSIAAMINALSQENKLRYASVEVIDADKLGHMTYVPGTECYRKIITHFQPILVSMEAGASGGGSEKAALSLLNDDKTINRATLGKIVFSNPEHRKTLEAFVWPEIKKLIKKHINESCRDEWSDKRTNEPASPFQAHNVLVDTTRVILVEAAVMIEAKFAELLDILIVSSVNPDVATRRLMARNKLSNQAASDRISAQISNEERLILADLAVENNGNKSDLEANVRRVWSSLVDGVKVKVNTNSSSTASDLSRVSEKFIGDRATALNWATQKEITANRKAESNKIKQQALVQSNLNKFWYTVLFSSSIFAMVYSWRVVWRKK